MAARIRKIWTPQVVRDRIRVGWIVSRLHQHISGAIEMSPTQLRAAEILLKKALPDLTAIEHSGEVINGDAASLTREQLIAIASGGGTRAVEARECEQVVN